MYNNPKQQPLHYTIYHGRRYPAEAKMMGSVMKAAAGGGAPEAIAKQAREVGSANDVEGGGEGGLVVVFQVFRWWQ